ncbi:MAG: amidohydrolase family protein, partial [Saprospiraceae bacterium]
MKKSCCLFIFYLIFITYSSSQNIDILIKNGLLIDPANNIHAIKDIAVHEGKILKVGTDFTLFKAKKTIDAKGLIVCPGFIDLHTHVFVGSKPDVFADGIYSLSPDDITLKAGVTTVVDAGTSGWRNFPQFKQQVIDQSKTRILAWLNISGNGMSAKDSETDINDIDPDNA